MKPTARIVRCPTCWDIHRVSPHLRGYKCPKCGEDIRVVPPAKERPKCIRHPQPKKGKV